MSLLDAGTGIPGLDGVINKLRIGDNVVWQVDDLISYSYLADKFTENALKEKRRVVYIRFASHAPVISPHPDIKVYDLSADGGFESFSKQVHEIATREGEGVFYVFDCLSDLLSAWASDLMTGNFFQITCPYLFELNTIAYFAILRNRHSFRTIARIRETTQLLLDVYNIKKKLYIHPLKVWNRYSPTMFLPHVQEKDLFVPITNSFDAAKLFSSAANTRGKDAERALDYWDRLFLDTERYKNEKDSDEKTAALDRLARIMIGKDPKMLAFAKQHFSLEDLLEIKSRLIGTGMIGGKAVGMLLAQAILKRNDPQRWSRLLEGHDSFYIGADVFYTYLVRNGCWWIRRRQKTAQDFLEGAQQIRRRIITGVFPREVEEELTRMLDYFGCSPIIVRSSSLLEDNFGNAFAGKYESVFCPNQGSLQQRLEDFKSAVRTVYASAMSEDALAYRKCHNLLDKEEQMGLLVQRVSGVQREDLFYPDVAGVGFSYNPYVWHEDIDPEAGIVRLVFGLGTRAVNRADDDYTRIIALNAPMQTPESGRAAGRKYFQHKVDVLDLNANHLTTMDFSQVLKYSLDGPARPWRLLAMRDADLERQNRQEGRKTSSPLFINFDKFITSTDFVKDMRDALNVIERAYSYPVDIEFTLNFVNETEYRINIVQCRPLQVKGSAVAEAPPDNIAESRLLMRSSGPVIGQPRSDMVDRFIFVNPDTYGQLPVQERHRVARMIGKLTHTDEVTQHPHIMLLGPGRWGTSTPSLGVPVTFSEIETVSILCEIVAMREDLVPDVSMGTHFFSELVEMEMLYLTFFPDTADSVLAGDFFVHAPNHLTEVLPEAEPFADVIRYICIEDVAPGARVRLYADPMKQKTLCYIEP